MDLTTVFANRMQTATITGAGALMVAALGVGIYFGMVRGDFEAVEEVSGRPPAQASVPAKPTLPSSTASKATRTAQAGATREAEAQTPPTVPTSMAAAPAKQILVAEPNEATVAKGPVAKQLRQAPPGPIAALPAPAPTTSAPAEPQPPRFDVVRISKDRIVVMAGRAPARARVTLLDGDQPLAEVDADERGEWAVVLDKPMAGGVRRLNLRARLADGRRIDSEAPIVVILPEDVAPREAKDSEAAVVVRLPAGKHEASRILQKPSLAAVGKGSDTLSLDVIDYDDTGNVVIAGSAPDGAAVRVYLDNRPIGDAITSGEKIWQVVPERAIAAGNYALRLDHLGPDGNVVARIEVPFTRVEARLAASFSASDRVVVQPGNNLWNIARRTYGRGTLYSIIFESNAEQIRDPDLIYPGQIFSLPKFAG